jgi:putative transposase
MCRVLDVSVSGYYAWRRRPTSRRERENQKLVVEIKAIHAESYETYGSPRIHAELRARGFECNRKRVERLMRLYNIRAKQTKRKRTTTNSNHKLPVAPNRLDRQFEATGSDEKWIADITYVPTAEGWLYLAAVMDLYSRRIIGWAMEHTLTSRLAEKALSMALTHRRPEVGVLHHSDRGVQYASGDYQALLDANGLIPSMSRTGNYYDQAPIESFFGTLKSELIHHRRYLSRAEARQDIFEYIEGFYNRRRRHSALGYLSPVEFEQQHQLYVN